MELVKISVKSCEFGTYLTADGNEEVKASGKHGPWESFSIIYHNDDSVSFKTAHGTYLRAAPHHIDHQAKKIGPWEKFHIIENGPRVAIVTDHGKFLSIDKSVVTVKDKPGPWEMFEIGEPQVALKSCAFGTFISADKGSPKVVGAGKKGPWEKLILKIHPDYTVSFKTVHGTYLRADQHHIDHNSKKIGPWEKFRIRCHIGYVELRTAHGKFLSAEKADVSAKDSPGPWEKFEIVDDREQRQGHSRSSSSSSSSSSN